MVRYHESHTSHNTHHEPQRRYRQKHTPDLQSHTPNYVRSTFPHVQPPNPPPPRRRRWATGYINRQSCPSYAYIDTGARSNSNPPDGEYPSDTQEIVPQRRHRVEDEYIKPLEDQPGYSSRHRREKHGVELGGSARAVSPRDDEDGSHESDIESLDVSPSPSYLGLRRRRERHESPPFLLSDSSDSSDSSISSSQQRTRATRTTDRRAGSDTVSLRRSCSSVLESDTRSIASVGGRSDVQEWSGETEWKVRGEKARMWDETQRGRRSGSESDSEGGYISLDEYIGGSDCVDWETEEDGGEGSDAVGSDVVSISDGGEGSDGVMGSDVESFDGSAGSCSLGEDFIDDEDGGPGVRYQRW